MCFPLQFGPECIFLFTRQVCLFILAPFVNSMLGRVWAGVNATFVHYIKFNARQIKWRPPPKDAAVSRDLLNFPQNLQIHIWKLGLIIIISRLSSDGGHLRILYQ